MKVRWWQGGVFIEPESDVEAQALLILTRSIQMDLPEETDTPKPPDPRASGETAGGETLL